MSCFPRGKQARQFPFILPPCRTEKRAKDAKIISPAKKQKKMKKYLLILMSFVLIMAASCTKEAMTENPDRKSVGTEASNKTKALDYLDRLLEDLYGETKSGIPEYNPDNVEALTAGQICPTKSKLKEQQNMFHCNWGWNGTSDGYFIQGIFDTSERIAEDENDTAPSDNFQPGNYVWHYRPITYSL